MKSIFIILFLFHSALFANSCEEEIRLDQKGGIMEKLPPLEQGGLGICYSVAATEVYDAYRLQKDPKAKALSSAHYAALLFALNHKKEKLNIESGDAVQTLRDLIEHGGCSDEYFRKNHDAKKIERSFEKILELKRTYDLSLPFYALNQEKWNYQGLEWMGPQITRMHERINGEIQLAQRAYTHNPQCIKDELEILEVESQTVKKIMTLVKDQEIEKLITELPTIICPSEKLLGLNPPAKVIRPNFYASAKVKKFSAEMRKSIKKGSRSQQAAIEQVAMSKENKVGVTKNWIGEQLKKNQLPITITYCAGLVISPVTKWIEQELAGPIPLDKCKSHASVIIGRRKKTSTGKCQILIRNSWGSDPTQKYLTYDPRIVDVEGPNFWVDEDLIYSSANLQVSTLTSKN